MCLAYGLRIVAAIQPMPNYRQTVQRLMLWQNELPGCCLDRGLFYERLSRLRILNSYNAIQKFPVLARPASVALSQTLDLALAEGCISGLKYGAVMRHTIKTKWLNFSR